MFGEDLIPMVQQSLPGKVPDQTKAIERRMGQYDETFILNPVPDFGISAEEGSLFCVNNGQTGIATAAAPVAFSATNPFFYIYNTDVASAAGGGKRILMDFLALINTAVGTAGANVQFAIVLDRGPRGISGGTNLTSLIKNVNPNIANASIALVYAGNLTVNAATANARTIVGNRYMKGAIPVIGDTYMVKFGGVDAPSMIGASAMVFSQNNVPKIIVPADWTATLHLWLASQSAASSYIPEAAWQER